MWILLLNILYGEDTVLSRHQMCFMLIKNIGILKNLFMFSAIITLFAFPQTEFELIIS